MNHVTVLGSGAVETEPVVREPVYHADFTMGEHSARHLRRILRLYLVERSLLDVADAAELALTELIANVVRHVPGRHCQLCIYLMGDEGVRVEVTDSSPGLPTVTVREALDEGGRGLLLVDAVTGKWGVDVREDGGSKTVWFECLTGGRGVAESG
ncbi:ATP-binding protein [Streptomyces sp. NPDC005576]|uniref:ATP-binding protein n=2 Tax=unclassified Streptomyces TaxID=2593676 RepID=UPI0036B31EEE